MDAMLTVHANAQTNVKRGGLKMDRAKLPKIARMAWMKQGHANARINAKQDAMTMVHANV